MELELSLADLESFLPGSRSDKKNIKLLCRYYKNLTSKYKAISIIVAKNNIFIVRRQKVKYLKIP